LSVVLRNIVSRDKVIPEISVGCYDGTSNHLCYNQSSQRDVNAIGLRTACCNIKEVGRLDVSACPSAIFAIIETERARSPVFTPIPNLAPKCSFSGNLINQQK